MASKEVQSRLGYHNIAPYVFKLHEHCVRGAYSRRISDVGGFMRAMLKTSMLHNQRRDVKGNSLSCQEQSRSVPSGQDSGPRITQEMGIICQSRLERPSSCVS